MATTRLEEYVVKGFTMDDERLKRPAGADYFDELLARIREIRASEARVYQRIREIFALASDYAEGGDALGATWSITSFRWSASRWPSARCCSKARRTSCGQIGRASCRERVCT